VKEFLKSSQATDPVLSGYFGAIMSSLQEHKSASMSQYRQSDPEIDELLMSRLDTLPISNLLKAQGDHDMFKMSKIALVDKNPETKLNFRTILTSHLKEMHTTQRQDSKDKFVFYFDKEMWSGLSKEILKKHPPINFEQKLSAKATAELFSEFISLLDKNKKFISENPLIDFDRTEFMNTKLAQTIQHFRTKYLHEPEQEDTWVADFLVEYVFQLSNFLKNVGTTNNR
jgi:hypothetical protein